MSSRPTPGSAQAQSAVEADADYELYCDTHEILRDASAGRRKDSAIKLVVLEIRVGSIAGQGRSEAVHGPLEDTAEGKRSTTQSKREPYGDQTVFFQAASQVTLGILVAQRLAQGESADPLLQEWWAARGEPNSIADLGRKLGSAVTPRIEISGLRELAQTVADKRAAAPRWSDEERGYRALAVMAQAAIDVHDLEYRSRPDLTAAMSRPRAPSGAQVIEDQTHPADVSRTGARHPLRDAFRNVLARRPGA